ncbi:ABC transporter substrate-binding protein [Alicyclobacillus fastidiosus]|uniref:ABC transporter substrate-binding protein n=1 Tax=Alicyclobacillus fastidiosus TaxID=392011 RepID=A0ABV5AHF5_9BACL|nr:ABC transporter substrate-binding protein [Alicyclobacillus fastidiosus]WEH08921.1 ABC transporter substrate-binding protein [Alicyclobacillus fastidiosus]
MVNWRRQSCALVTTVGMIAFLLSGCGTSTSNASGQTTDTKSQTNQQSDPVRGGDLQLDMSQDIHSIDPAVAEDVLSDEFVQSMYDQLVTYKGTTNDLVGDAAQTWDVSADGKTYTFHLRKGIHFWNGDPLTADSYIAEFERMLNKKIASPGESLIDPIIQGSTAYHDGKSTTISGVTAPNPYTLKIVLTKPEPFFLNILAMHFFVGIDPAWIQQVGDAAFGLNKPMGTGAFELKSNNNNVAVLTRNPHYFQKDEHGNQLPYLNQITFTYNNNTELDAMRFERGETAFLGFNTRGIPSSAYQQFVSNPSLKQDVLTSSAGTIWYMGLNVQQPPFTNVKVRQAVEYAIDKPLLVKLLDNQDSVANQPTPPGVFGHVEDLPSAVNYTYNPQKAKELLKESGLSLPIKAKFYSSNDSSTLKIINQIQSDLKAVGIDISPESTSWGTFLTLNAKGNQPSFLIDWNQTYPDASDFLYTLLNSSEQPANNSTMYSNADVDRWLNQAQTDTNQEDRANLYKQVTIQVMQDATIVPLYYGKYIYAIQPWVHGYYINRNLEEDPLAHIWVDPTHQ